MHKYPFSHPAVTVDAVVFGLDKGDLKLLLVKRGLEPYRGKWALPGGFVGLTEDLEDAARRELREEAGVSDVFLEQLFTFGDPGRDPRERVITVAYWAIIRSPDYRLHAATDASDAAWFPVKALPDLAFDHLSIAKIALDRLRTKVRYQPIGFEFLPEKFTLSMLQDLYQTILGRMLDKRNFRKKILRTKLLVPLDEYQDKVAHRAAQLFRFDKDAYVRFCEAGFNFEI